MKKIALITCYFQPNYGSQLQAFATQEIFDKLEFRNETICIDGLRREINNSKYRYFLSRAWDLNTIKDKWATIRKVIAKKTNKQYEKDLMIRLEMFNSFANSKFNLSRVYDSKSELTKNAELYDAFVVGSDQLWLPSNIEADYYTLNFVPKQIPRMSLATSFGISHLPKKQAKKAIDFLPRINYLSVREDSGKQLIKDLTGLDVPVVCDPTLLFTAEEWDQKLLPKNVTKGRYILCYFLGNNPSQRSFVKKIKECTGYKIIQLAHLDEYIKSDVGFADETPYNIGPAEFVKLIRDAEYILTDSFHCTVFSMLYKKIFFSFRRYKNDSSVSTNSRLYSLLYSVGLEGRLLNADEDVKQCLSLSVNYDEVHQKIDLNRKFTMDFIKTAFTNIYG